MELSGSYFEPVGGARRLDGIPVRARSRHAYHRRSSKEIASARCWPQRRGGDDGVGGHSG
eukprot:9001094-Pyramimonas_sp.AAC.1